MTAEHWRQVNQLFHQVLKLQPETREAWLDRTCSEAPALRAELTALLSAHEQSDSFIDTPVLQSAVQMIAQDFDSLPIGQQLNSYRILSQIGTGGMGEVWLAEDTRLDRKVALKFLPAIYTHDSHRLARFRLEARADAAMNHPNIATIYSIEEAADHHFIAMEYVDGKPLSDPLFKQACDLKLFFTWFVPLSDALAHAHEHGVIHRDIKPGNIMISATGKPKLLDFGLAKLIEMRIEERETTETMMADRESMNEETETSSLHRSSFIAHHSSMPGIVMGTPAYMSPEQAAGEPVGCETDIFSLGVICYEFLTGQHPFAFASKEEMPQAIRSHTPKAPTNFRPEIPTSLEALILQMLEKDAQLRPDAADVKQCLEAVADQFKIQTLIQNKTASSEKVSEEHFSYLANKYGLTDTLPKQEIPVKTIFRHRLSILSRRKAVLLTALILGIVLVSITWHRYYVTKLVQPADNIPTLAILPFKPLSTESRNQFLEFGMADALITRLGNLEGIIVMSANAVVGFNDSAQDPLSAGRKLKAEAVLDGKIQKVGDQIRVIVRLLRVQDGSVLWADTIDGNYSSIFQTQELIAERVAALLTGKFNSRDQLMMARRYALSTECYELVLKGRYYLHRQTPNNWQKAVESLTQALAIEPDYAPAYAWLAVSYIKNGINGEMEASLAKSKGEEFANKAIELDPSLDLPYFAIGTAHLFFEWDWKKAEQAYKKALELNPNNPEGNLAYAHYLAAVGRANEAITVMKHSLVMEPLSVYYNMNLAKLLYLGHRYDEAIKQCQKTLELDPNYSSVHYWYGMILLHQGRVSEAELEIRQWLRLSDRPELSSPDMGVIHAFAGKPDKTRKILSILIESQEKKFVEPYDFVRLYHALGEREQTFNWMERTVESRSAQMIMLKVDPYFDDLHADPKYQSLLSRIGLD